MIESSFFTANRQRCLSGKVAVFAAHTSLQQKGDMAYTFSQESNFWYLTGISDPGWQLIVDGARAKAWLVAPTISQTHALFDGSLGWDDAKTISGVDAVVSRTEADRILVELAKKHSVVYAIGDDPHASYYDFVQNPASKELWKSLNRQFRDVQDCRKDILKHRAIKQPEEIKALKKSIDLTVDAFRFVKERLEDFKYEYEAEAEFSYYFRQNGASGHAYSPIIAGGKNACTLHYSTNNDRLKKRSLLLMDVGALTDEYPADITRTYALGVPTARQIAVHAAVESVHRQTIDLLRPGLLIKSYLEKVDEYMGEALASLGLIEDKRDKEGCQKYFPHAISHGLGIDVHDSLGGFSEFQPGMVLTVEPGIYIPNESIGVRIEDDILITQTSYDNLSVKLSTDL